MSEAIWIAIIGGSAAVIAAIIAGIFSYMSREKKKSQTDKSEKKCDDKQVLKIKHGKIKKGILQKGRGMNQKLDLNDVDAESVTQENL